MHLDGGKCSQFQYHTVQPRNPQESQTMASVMNAYFQDLLATAGDLPLLISIVSDNAKPQLPDSTVATRLVTAKPSSSKIRRNKNRRSKSPRRRRNQKRNYSRSPPVSPTRTIPCSSIPEDSTQRWESQPSLRKNKFDLCLPQGDFSSACPSPPLVLRKIVPDSPPRPMSRQASVEVSGSQECLFEKLLIKPMGTPNKACDKIPKPMSRKQSMPSTTSLFSLAA